MLHSDPDGSKGFGSGENSPVGALGNGSREVKSAAFALKAAVSFSVSSLEPALAVPGDSHRRKPAGASGGRR